MATETYDFLPEPLRSIAAADAAIRHRQLRVWGTVAGLGGAGLVAYLGYFIARRVAHGAGFHVRSSEVTPLAAGLVLCVFGALLFGSTRGADPVAAKLRQAGATIVECGRQISGGAKFLWMKLGDGTEVRWRLGVTPDRQANATTEAAALAAVKRLPQWAGAK